MSRCTGHCCERFTLPYDYDTMQARLADSRLETPKEPVITDIEIIAPMIIPLGEEHWDPATGNDLDGRTIHHYTCKNFNKSTGDCGIYEKRPQMCRDYPYDRPCHYNGCTRSDKEQA